MRENFLSRKRSELLIQRMRGRRIGVLGDWMLDRYVWGTANRISPEAAVPIVEFSEQSDRLGGAGNVAANLAALGAKVESFGVTGRDEAGGALRNILRAMRLPEKGIIEETGRPTTLKTRIIARHQQVVRVDREVQAPLTAKSEEILARRILEALPRLEALIVSDYDKGVVTETLAERVLRACAKHKIPPFIKPPKPPQSRTKAYEGAAVVVCNRLETEFLVEHGLESRELVRRAGAKLLDRFGSLGVVITRGPEGLDLFERDRPEDFHVAALRQERPMGVVGKSPDREAMSGRQVFDVTGAGDTVLATMALACAAGATFREGVMMGNAAAGVVVSKLGTASLTTAELGAALEDPTAITSTAAEN